MQKEIESLIVALQAEQQRETEMLLGILSALAVGGAARSHMIHDIGAAASCAIAIPPANLEASKDYSESEVVSAIQRLRRRAA